MIVDNLANAANYFSLHPLFEKEFEYISEFIIFSTEDGHAPLIGEGATRKDNIKVALI
jgi:beta-galactosidase beta subunit